MLEGIQTGYEAEYDFPHRRYRPERVYMLASVPRSGSTFLSHLLWQSGCLGAPLEYLNFLSTGPYSFASGSPEKQIELWRSALHRRTSPNGVFGAKCFPLQLRELQQDNPALLLEVINTLLPGSTTPRVVRLKRRDTDSHAISFARAALSGIWRKEQEAIAGATVEYSEEAVDHARELLKHQETEWDRLFGELAIQPLTLWYEDVVEQPERAVGSVAAFLDVHLDAASAIVVPQVEKQSGSDSKRWAQRYAASVKR
jgi:trehalose 2-sulfotransferase